MYYNPRSQEWWKRLWQVIMDYQGHRLLSDPACCMWNLGNKTASFTFTFCFVEVTVHCLDLAHPQKVFTVSLRASFGCIYMVTYFTVFTVQSQVFAHTCRCPQVTWHNRQLALSILSDIRQYCPWPTLSEWSCYQPLLQVDSPICHHVVSRIPRPHHAPAPSTIVT